MNKLNNDDDLGVLRFITAGSVDDGKSTLIGRLLFDSKAVMTDQVKALEKAKNKRTSGEAIDFSLLTDGLEAEREQGITIDIAYRYFSSPRRKFIIADAPGHVQYTRNMVTGTSTSDVAVILIDVTRVTEENGQVKLLAQTKRHSKIVRLLGLPHVIVAINKMDLVDYDQGVFDKISKAYADMALQLGLKSVHYVPVSALRGDNIVDKSDAMSWYQGPTLLDILETLPLPTLENAPLRFPVQYVMRQDGSSSDDFRGYMGRVEAGAVKAGDAIKVLPAGIETTVTQVLGRNGDQGSAVEGDCITLVLADDVDVSRGDVFVLANDPITPVKELNADLCWLSEEPLTTSRKYVMRQGTTSVFAKIKSINQVMDVETLSESSETSNIQMNDIGRVSLVLAKPIVCDPYDVDPAMGAFVLIDETTNATVAAGMIH